MKLIIVESPTKSKTLKQFLGKDYEVAATFGHIRDLPKSELGIDIEKDFEPKYIIPVKARPRVKELKDIAAKAQKIILGLDEDREGEAIAWHLVQILDLNEIKNKKLKIKNYQRIVFHEITKQAIENALKNPRDIDINLVDAQQARRILDRLVGYKLSPFLWKKVVKGLSAGRVQSVAVRLVCEREREIRDFKTEEYWTIVASLLKMKDKRLKIKDNEFEAILVKKDGKVIPKFGIKTEKETEKIVKDLEDAEYRVIDVEKKEIKRSPLPPFTTSTLQQEAWQRFRFPAKLTMSIAQQLYEKGYISYHRTDSLNLSDQSLFQAKKFIEQNYGENYWAGFFRRYKTKSKGAQEAHEAIRPTYPDKKPETIKTELDKNQLKLYDLIWHRFIASQMAQARFDATIVEIEAQNPKLQISNSDPQIPTYTFRSTGQVLKFDGFLKVYPIKYEENKLPNLEINEILKLIKLIPLQHFTQPPARYTEATLIKALEQNGIGRPSTYAPILSTIQQRNYIEKNEQKKFQPTEIGIVVNDLLVKHFPEIVDIQFTAQMEQNLDKIAQGKQQWKPIIKEFYEPFEQNLKNKYQEISKRDIAEEESEKKCPKCETNLLIKLGRFGKFYVCPNFPKCKYTESLKKNTLGIKCPKCSMRIVRLRPSDFGNMNGHMRIGEITEKRTKKGKIFYACNRYPECDFALWDKPIGKFCEKCNSMMVEKKKRIKCSNCEK